MLSDDLLAAPPIPARPGLAVRSWLFDKPRTPEIAAAAILVALGTGLVGATRPRDGIAVVAAVAVVTLVLMRPFVGGLLLVSVVPVISGLAPGIPVKSVRASEALVGLIGVTLLVGARKRDCIPWEILDWTVLAFGIAWAAFGAGNALALHEHLSLSQWGTVFGQLQFFLIYRGVRLSVRTPRQRRVALGAFLVASVPVGLLAVAQQFRLPGVGSFLFTITGSQEAAVSAPGTVAPLSISDLHRATGPFANWTSLAGYFFPVLLLMCAIVLANQVGRRRRWFLAIAAVAASGLLVSDEQSAIIGLVAGIVALGVMSRRTREVGRWLLVALVVGGAVFGPTIGKRVVEELAGGASSSSSSVIPQTLGYRGQVWTGQYFPAIEQRLLTGYGVETPTTIQWPYTESEYVTILMQGGLPLLVVFGVMTWAMIDRSRRMARSPDPLDRALGASLTVGIVTLIVMDIIWPYMSNGGLPQVLWALLALGWAGGGAGWHRVPGRMRSGSRPLHPGAPVRPSYEATGRDLG